MPVPAKPSSIQSVAWETGLAAVRESIDFTDFEQFRLHIFQNMRQNSEGVRKRYTNLILLRLFPERSLQGIIPKVWNAYRDEKILEDLARMTTLDVEPVIAKFVLENIYPIQPGSIIANSTIKDYISSEFGAYKNDAYVRLKTFLIRMGFITNSQKGIVVQPIPLPNNAFLITIHAKLAPTPRIVRLSDIIGSVFWKLLGIRDEVTVRTILQDAYSKGAIAKYAVIDQLEQITTKYSYEEYLKNTIRL